MNRGSFRLFELVVVLTVFWCKLAMPSIDESTPGNLLPLEDTWVDKATIKILKKIRLARLFSFGTGYDDSALLPLYRPASSSTSQFCSPKFVASKSLVDCCVFFGIDFWAISFCIWFCLVFDLFCILQQRISFLSKVDPGNRVGWADQRISLLWRVHPSFGHIQWKIWASMMHRFLLWYPRKGPRPPANPFYTALPSVCDPASYIFLIH